MKKYSLPDLPSMEKMAADFLANLFESENLDVATVVALSGDLGSGKTTFTQFIGKTLGIDEQINSPTFVVSKTYSIPKDSPFYKKWKSMIHIDAYRLEGKNESKNIGLIEQMQNPENIIFIEWPEMIKKELPKGITWLDFEYISENERKITLQ